MKISIGKHMEVYTLAKNKQSHFLLLNMMRFFKKMSIIWNSNISPIDCKLYDSNSFFFFFIKHFFHLAPFPVLCLWAFPIRCSALFTQWFSMENTMKTMNIEKYAPNFFYKWHDQKIHIRWFLIRPNNYAVHSLELSM